MNQQIVKENTALAEAFFKALANENVDALLATVDDNAQFLAVAIGKPQTKAEMAVAFPQAWSAVAERKLELKNLFVSEDMVGLEYVNTGLLVKHPERYSSELNLKGKRFNLMACMILHIQNGKFIWMHEYFDLSGVNESAS